MRLNICVLVITIFLFYKIKQSNYIFECLKWELQDKIFPFLLIIIWSTLSTIKTKQTKNKTKNPTELFVAAWVRDSGWFTFVTGSTYKHQHLNEAERLDLVWQLNQTHLCFILQLIWFPDRLESKANAEDSAFVVTFVWVSIVVFSSTWVREVVAEEQEIESVGGKQLAKMRDCGV